MKISISVLILSVVRNAKNTLYNKMQSFFKLQLVLRKFVTG